VAKLDSSYTGALKVGNPLFNVPNWNAGLNGTYNLPRSSVGLQAQFTGTRRDWDALEYFAYYDACYAGENDCSRSWQTFYTHDYKPYWRLHLNASHWLTPRMQVFANVNNLLDDTSLNNSNYYLPKGRTTTLGFRFKP
jgi:hypothetical protein